MTANELETNGYCILTSAISAEACDQIRREITNLLETNEQDSIRAGAKSYVGARNLQQTWTGWREITKTPSIANLTNRTLGSSAGLVRILFFDKPPGKGWSLALHKDRTIAVKRHIRPALPFAKPTTKAGVPHVEATTELLENMLTLRLHLDSMHSGNGPLMVVPGSHQSVRESSNDATEIHCEVGDVFAMRPLLSHGSRNAILGNTDHRRVVHLEFAANESLPGGYEWYQFSAI